MYNNILILIDVSYLITHIKGVVENKLKILKCRMSEYFKSYLYIIILLNCINR